MTVAFDVLDQGMQCAFCTRDLMSEKERVFLLQCCKSGVHHSCLREKFPDWHLMTCPKCRYRTRVTAQVLRRDEFSPSDSDKIESCFLKHHVVSRVSMTVKEIEGLRIALNVFGFRAMRHVSHCVCRGIGVLVSPSERKSTGDCAECKVFASVFDGQRFTDHVALANRSHLYERMEKGLYNSFIQMKTKK